MQLTDLHLGEDWHLDQKTMTMVSEMIDKEQPDFIAVTGDIVSG
jgi:predicted MPP superfamily phosphohydrolase